MDTLAQINDLKSWIETSVIGQQAVVERLLLGLLGNGNLLMEGLLETMEERQVTVVGKTHRLPELFMVLAIQNPVEQEGTYPLPEAQMDRFLMHVRIDYHGDDAELEIIRLVRRESGSVSNDEAAPLAQQVIFDALTLILDIQISEGIERYIVSLVAATRRPEAYDEQLRRWIVVGGSPRATIALDKTARAFAWLQGRDHTTPDDVRAVVHDCLRHRLMLSYEAHADGVTADDVIRKIVSQVVVA